jgi:F-type H+-transporting ATPase subunit c
MAKWISVSLIVALVFGGLCVVATPVMAADNAEQVAAEEKTETQGPADYSKMLGVMGALLGVGIVVFGAASGIGKIAGNAVDAIARQPEAGGRIFTSMLLGGALIEGVAFFGLVVCLMAVLSLT